MLLIGPVTRAIYFNQSEAHTTEILVVTVISKEFLQSLLRRHFAGKPLSGGIAKFWLFSQVDFPYVFYKLKQLRVVLTVAASGNLRPTTL